MRRILFSLVLGQFVYRWAAPPQNNRTLNYFSTITDNRNTNINNNKTILFLSIYIRDPFVDE